MAVKRYNGSSWDTVAGLGAQGAAGADGTAPLTTKGDILTYGTAATRLPVGSNGETLVADSSASTGLRWQGNFAAGKNKIINGDFNIWQRGTSFSSPNGTYGPDRFVFTVSTAVPTWTVSQQTFTPGTAPVSGYEGTYFCRAVVTSQGSSTAQYMQHRIEDVRVFAGQTITFSFWAKAASTMTINECKIGQNFGSGGSSAVETAVTLNSTSIGTSWVKYTGTVTMPSVSGKTIGSSSYVYVYLQFNSSNGNYTFDTWGWQLEAGNVATAFQTATGTLAGELAACQRYYTRYTGGTNGTFSGFGTGTSSTQTGIAFSFGTIMRVIPTSIDFANLGSSDFVNATVAATTAVLNGNSTKEVGVVVITHASGITQYRPYVAGGSGGSGYVGFSAEL